MAIDGAGNISTVEKVKRLNEIKDLVDEGKDESAIAKELALPIATVRRNIKYLDELCVSNVSPEEMAEKRKELYLELVKITGEAEAQFIKYKTSNPTTARSYMYAQMKAIEMRAKLYGLDNNVTSVTQVNNQINVAQPEKLPSTTRDKIAQAIIDGHEKKVANK